MKEKIALYALKSRVMLGYTDFKNIKFLESNQITVEKLWVSTDHISTFWKFCNILKIVYVRRDPDKYRRSMVDFKEASLAGIPEASQDLSCCGIKVDPDKVAIMQTMMDFSLFKVLLFHILYLFPHADGYLGSHIHDVCSK